MATYKKFVILSSARSGTTLLTSALKELPGVICHGEIFHEKINWHIRETFLKTADMSQRERDPVGFTYTLLNHAPNGEAVGFKMWLDQNPAACEAVASDPSIAKIILERPNKLAHFSSGQLAQKSGIWNLSETEKLPDMSEYKASFQREAFERFLFKQGQKFSFYREKARGPVLELTYQDIVRQGHAPVCDFIGVPVDDTVEIVRRKKLHSGDILSRYEPESHAAILAYLKETGREDWLEENV